MIILAARLRHSTQARRANDPSLELAFRLVCLFELHIQDIYEIEVTGYPVPYLIIRVAQWTIPLKPPSIT